MCCSRIWRFCVSWDLSRSSSAHFCQRVQHAYVSLGNRCSETNVPCFSQVTSRSRHRGQSVHSPKPPHLETKAPCFSHIPPRHAPKVGFLISVNSISAPLITESCHRRFL